MEWEPYAGADRAGRGRAKGRPTLSGGILYLVYGRTNMRAHSSL